MMVFQSQNQKMRSIKKPGEEKDEAESLRIVVPRVFRSNKEERSPIFNSTVNQVRFRFIPEESKEEDEEPI